MTERQGVEIDYCPQCRGVWLDRGELDKIIDRAQPEMRSAPPPPEYRRDDYRDDDDDDNYGRRNRRGFLGNLFDFD
jgi:Zn-finger nucleic acid-binding protein